MKMFKTKKFKIFLGIMLGLLFCLPAVAAVNLSDNLGKVESGAFGATPVTPLHDTLGGIIRAVLSILGVVLVLIIIYAGFLWMTSGGSDDGVKKAKSWMLNAVVGLIIILSAYAITSFVISRLVEAGV
jgi:uncharacterized membrane protein